MSSFAVLFAGELQRMVRYSIIGASLLVAVLWIAVLHFSEVQDVGIILPLLLFVDAVSMAILLIGVTIFFEKQEGTLKTLLVSPVDKSEYILAKTCANISSNIMTLVILYGYAVLFRQIHLSFVALLGAVVLIAFFHSLIGFYLSYYAAGFTDLLMGMFKYLLVLMLPVLFEGIGLITNEILTKLMYLLPTKSAHILLYASSGEIELWEIVFSAAYLIVASAVLLTVVLRRFDEFAARESGV
ncbi:MAG: ABC transporter permease subunit [Bacillota bacterium]